MELVNVRKDAFDEFGEIKDFSMTSSEFNR
jgi:hypothetical protein